MKNSKTLFQDFASRIKLQESRDEIQSIAYLVFETVFGLSKTEVLAGKNLTEESLIRRLDEITLRINDHEPVQYILGEAAFYSRNFSVNPSVLIPRPETEELARLVIDFARQTQKTNHHIIDIGTGSGCIAVTLSLELPDAEVSAVDISEEALRIALANAQKLGASVKFQQLDILKEKLPFSIDIMVSNPPYIELGERTNMSKNVVQYEPQVALFVDSNDPLLFYNAIVVRATESLRRDGLLAVEINERFGGEVRQLLINHNFRDVRIIQDVFGKDRIVKGVLPS